MRETIERLRAAQRGLTPFNDDVVAFAADLSRNLRRHPEVREHPALAALAFWIRTSNVETMRRDWNARPGVRMPRGVVFHIPPTNVDTLFVYSWLLAALAGNANVVRLSPAATVPGPLRAVLDDTLGAHPRIAATTELLSYGHDDAITEALSTADVRVVWGGDDTVAAIRRIPLAVHATELAFPDRFSLAAFDADAVLHNDVAELASRFFNDAYWFDQLGCASPRLVVWRGSEAETIEAAQRFYDALDTELVRRDHTSATGAVIAKLVHAADAAAAGAVDRVDWSHNDRTIAHLRDLDSIVRDGPGGGLFYDVRVDDLADLAPHVVRRDQTLTHYGFTARELDDFAQRCNGQGIDRIVPVGQALAFDRIWDGYDLLDSFTRCVVVDPGDRTLATPAARADETV
jgi:hypothetical protein